MKELQCFRCQMMANKYVKMIKMKCASFAIKITMLYKVLGKGKHKKINEGNTYEEFKAKVH